MTLLTLHTMSGSQIPSDGHPTWKVGHSDLQKVVNLSFLTSSPKSLVLVLKSLNLSEKKN